MKPILLRLISVIAFGLALAMCLPPVPSDPSSKYAFFPVGMLAIALLAVSRAIDKTAGISWWQGLIELGILAGFGFLSHERALM